jgi:hypothetical protein
MSRSERWEEARALVEEVLAEVAESTVADTPADGVVGTSWREVRAKLLAERAEAEHGLG